MSWQWRYEASADVGAASTAGADRPASSELFANQADAESWLGQSYPELRAAGFEAVTLFEDERVEYRMSLLPTT